VKSASPAALLAGAAAGAVLYIYITVQLIRFLHFGIRAARLIIAEDQAPVTPPPGRHDPAGPAS
jgi:hypothetical protein